VTFKGGFSADWSIVTRLLDIEARCGITFQLADEGRFRVVPAGRLTPADQSFLRARRDEVRAVISYYTGEVPA
jgi:hypothetical protein